MDQTTRVSRFAGICPGHAAYVRQACGRGSGVGDSAAGQRRQQARGIWAAGTRLAADKGSKLRVTHDLTADILSYYYSNFSLFCITAGQRPVADFLFYRVIGKQLLRLLRGVKSYTIRSFRALLEASMRMEEPSIVARHLKIPTSSPLSAVADCREKTA